MERLITVADTATATTVLADLYASMGRSSGGIDLEGLWTNLGVVVVQQNVKFNQAAPAAHIRRAIGQRQTKL